MGKGWRELWEGRREVGEVGVVGEGGREVEGGGGGRLGVLWWVVGVFIHCIW